MVTHKIVHTEGQFVVLFNEQKNAYNPFSVCNTLTGKTEFTYDSLGVCLDYISDNVSKQG